MKESVFSGNFSIKIGELGIMLKIGEIPRIPPHLRGLFMLLAVLRINSERGKGVMGLCGTSNTEGRGGRKILIFSLRNL